MISVEKIETLEGLDGLRTVWDQLLAKSDFRNIFLTFDWLRTWWKVFGDDRELYVLVVKSDAEIIGVAPLMLEKSKRLGRTVKVIKFIGTPNVDYGDFIGEDKKLIVEHVAGYLYRNRKDWFRVELDQISERSSTLSHLQVYLGTGKWPFTTRQIETCLAYVYEGGKEDRSKFKIKRSHSMRRSINRFNDSGGLDITRLDNPGKVQSELLDLFQLHINRWAATPTPSKFLDPGQRKFYQELVEVLFPQNRICFIALKNGPLPVAYSFNFEYENTIYHYTLGHNEYLSRRSPGSLLVILETELLIRQGFDLDFSRGAAEYKRLLTNRSYANFQIILYSQRFDFMLTKFIEGIKSRKITRAILGNRRLQYHKLKIIGILSEKGWMGLLKQIFVSAFRSVIDYREFYLFRHDGEPVILPSPKIDVAVKMLGVEELGSIATFYCAKEGSEKYETILKRFEKNAHCLAAIHDGKIVYLSWSLFGEDFWRDHNLSIKPGSDEVIFSDALASPIYGCMGLYTYMLAYKLNKYSREGYKPLSGVAKSNIPALRGARRFGLEHIRTYRRLKLFSRWIIG